MELAMDEDLRARVTALECVLVATATAMAAGGAAPLVATIERTAIGLTDHLTDQADTLHQVAGDRVARAVVELLRLVQLPEALEAERQAWLRARGLLAPG
jgi:hypothetical protein